MANDDPTTPPDEADIASDEIVMFFLGPDGEPLESEQPAAARTIGDLYRAWRAALDEEREREDYHRHRPVERKVEGIGRPGKTGYRDEIVVTLKSDPMRAVTQALRGDLFEPAFGRLVVDTSSLETHRYELRWRVVIRVSPWWRRRARLRLYASPSLNVSVLSLLPMQPRSIARTRFLRIGLRVMNQLRDRIDDRVREDGITATA